jgi:hypothetical protein
MVTEHSANTKEARRIEVFTGSWLALINCRTRAVAIAAV